MDARNCLNVAGKNEAVVASSNMHTSDRMEDGRTDKEAGKNSEPAIVGAVHVEGKPQDSKFSKQGIKPGTEDQGII